MLETAAHKPLTGASRILLIAGAALGVGLFYVFAALAALILLLVIGLEAVVALILARFGFMRVMTPIIRKHSRLAVVFVRSLWVRRGTEFQLTIAEADAPMLFAALRDIAAFLDTAMPERIVLEMNAGAWVSLKGFGRGSNKATLGLGYDLVAGLTQTELTGVLAHEMAHAKLIHRGLVRSLNRGVSRAANLASLLTHVVDSYRRAKADHSLEGFLLGPAMISAHFAARMVARYSRQNEFEADREAARYCGPAPLRSALLKLDRISHKTRRIGWSERIARLREPGGYASWLVEQLKVTPLGEAPDAYRDRFSTHPALIDRLAALPPATGAPSAESPLAIRMLAAPDDVAARLIAEITRVLELEEARDSRQRIRWLRRYAKGGGLRRSQTICAVVTGAGVVVWAFGVFIDIGSVARLSATAALAAGLGGLWFVRFRERQVLPVPDYAGMKRASDRKETGEELARRERAESEALRAVAGGASSKEKLARLITAGFEALGRCDYVRAYAAARLAFEIDKHCVEAGLTLGIAAASFGQRDLALHCLHLVRRDSGLRTFSCLWGCAWLLYLLHDATSAEPMLEQALTMRNSSTLRVILAQCQGARNKLQSAIRNAQRALEDGASHKETLVLLVNLHSRAGNTEEVSRLMAKSPAEFRSDPDLAVAAFRIHVLREDRQAADDCIAMLRGSGTFLDHAVELAGACEHARRDEEANGYYQEALQSGFYPDAHLGLARLALAKEDRLTARSHALAALNNAKKTAENARTPIQAFANILEVLVRAETPVEGAQAWVATVTGNTIAGPIANHSFLVVAPDEASSRRCFKEVTDALAPEQPTLHPTYISWQKAPKDQQPVRRTPPGIHRFWRN